MARLFVLVCLSLFLVSCAGLGGPPPIERGKVIEKDYDSAHYKDVKEQQLVSSKRVSDGQTCTTTNGKRKCTTKYKTKNSYKDVKKRKYIPAEWDIVVQDCSREMEDGKCRQEEIDITEDEYNRLQIGSEWVRNPSQKP